MNLVLAVMFAWWMAWGDIKTKRIPNYLTVGSALAGLVYQGWSQGWPGVADGFLGIGLGFVLLIFFYWRGRLGAGDVKALTGLGAWVGAWLTIYLFIFTGISGIFLIVGLLWWRGLLWGKIQQLWQAIVNLILLRSHPAAPGAQAAPSSKLAGIPYAVAMAVGLTALICWRSFR
jgi:prepilin peptidase CpaA